ncbi:hypothetical protein WR25_10224 [Diploscapter pachys]|uniref:Uncharacterized protein n=1 Tax=Diploscapter pachys TaxID=2018661 RepID=A0A2A2L5J6_9BILA|nr:hypothetical protein WR25_10224 [Diploscapter pachys]
MIDMNNMKAADSTQLTTEGLTPVLPGEENPLNKLVEQYNKLTQDNRKTLERLETGKTTDRLTIPADTAYAQYPQYWSATTPWWDQSSWNLAYAPDVASPYSSYAVVATNPLSFLNSAAAVSASPIRPAPISPSVAISIANTNMNSLSTLSQTRSSNSKVSHFL